MKRMFYTLFATTLALSLLISAGVFAAQDTETPCPVHVKKACFKKDGACRCGWAEEIQRTRLMILKKGQPEWVRVNSTRSRGVPCPNSQVATSAKTARYFAGPKVGWITVPAEKEILHCEVCS
jgi:hypothetical protein